MNQDRLKTLLAMIERYDTVYTERYGLILRAVSLAYQLGFAAGFRIDPREPDWPVAFIELPTGQVSWHIQPHQREWDGHTTEEKYRRAREFILDSRDDEIVA